MSAQETHAEIIAEMRGAKTEFPFVYLMGETITPAKVDFSTKEIIEPSKTIIRRITVKELADRLEAAHKRERSDGAKLREFARLVSHMNDDGYWNGSASICALVSKAKAALAAPPRNCDRFKDALDAWDAYDAWVDSYRAQGKIEPFNEFGWLFARAATEKEGSAK